MMRSTLRGLLVLSVLGIVALSIASSLWRFVPQTALLAPMAMQFAAAAAMLGVIAMLVRHRGLAVLAFAALGWNLLSIWPDIAPSSAAEADASPVLRVMSFNLWFDNHDIDRTADALAASGADVIGLVEATPRLKAGLANLRAVYPYSVDCVGAAWKCQTILLSKYPLKNIYAGPIDDRFPYIATAEVEKAGMPSIVVAVTHLSWPFAVRALPPLVTTTLDRPDPELPGVPALEQSVQAANLAAFLAKQPGDLVLMGDFNAASWSPLLVSFRAATGLAEDRRLLPSWPSWAWPIFRIPLDHVFARGRARVADIALGPAIGSDHLPLMAKIAIAP